MTKPKVLLLAKAYPPDTGGVETYSEEVALAYRSFGYEVIVVTQCEAPPGARRRGGICVINVGRGGQLRVFAKLTAVVRRLLKRHRFAFVHATTWRVGLVTSLLGGPRPQFLTVHGREVAQTNLVLRPLMHFVFNNTNHCIVISSCSLDVCSKIEPTLSRIGIVSWNGLTYRSIAHSKSRFDTPRDREQPIRLLSVCRLVRRKNVEGTLRALHILKSRDIENWTLEIVGSGPQLEYLKSLAEDLDLAGHVTFLGHRPRSEMPDLYCAADIFIHPQTHSHDPADFESFCLTIVDAMSFGLPVVAGSAGAPAEYLTHGHLGFVVDGINHAALADELTGLIDDENERTRVGKAARSWALNTLSWPNHIGRLLDAAGITPPRNSDQTQLAETKTQWPI